MPLPGRTRLVSLSAVTLILGGLAVIGFCLLFAHFPAYDDEGYILLTAREVGRRGGLYDIVYSQYGPAFYALTTLIQSALAHELDHASTRILTLILWIATALAGGLIVARHTRSVALFAFATIGAFLYLHFTPHEAFHPGTLIIFILAGSILALDGLLMRDRQPAFMALGGAVVAMLLLIKVNIGIFHLFTLGAWLLLHAMPTRPRGLLRCAVSALLLMAAAGLMREHVRESWVLIFLAVFAVGTITVVATLPTPVRIGHWTVGYALLAGLALIVIVLGATLLRGTTLRGLLDGVLLGPLRHASSYSYAVDWRPGTLFSAAFSLGVAGIVLGLRRTGKSLAADGVVVLVRGGLAAGLLAAMIGVMHVRVIGAVFSFVLPWLWVSAVSLHRVPAGSTSGPVRSLLALTILLQSLQAYPIGGIQEAWGTFLIFPLLALALGEAAGWLHENAPRATARALVVTTGSLLLIGSLGKMTWTAVEVAATYRAQDPLDLPGTRGLRLPAPMADAYRILCVNAVVHGDMLFSLPGMFSFNLWTGLPTPTQRNTTVWFTLLNEREQEGIIAALERSPRACIIVDEGLLQLMHAHDVAVTGPLRDYLLRQYAPVIQIENIGFLVRRGRTVTPLNITHPASTVTPDARGFDTVLTFQTLGSQKALDRIVITEASGAASQHVLQAGNAVVTLTPVDRSGRATGASFEPLWPVSLPPGLAAVSLRFSRDGLDLRRSALRLVATDGTEMAVIRPHD